MYIKHFLEYYRKLGFKKIFLYDNNDINDEKFEDVIKNEIKSGFVSIINYRGFRGNGKTGSQQMNAYYDCYKKNNLFYDWIAFFDVDEYLVLYKDKNIQKFLTSSRYKNCEIIRYNNQLEFEDKPLIDRFIEKIEINSSINTFCKIMVRGNLANYNNRKIRNPHVIFHTKKLCDSSGNIKYGFFLKPPVYEYASLNHYHTKSIREYCQKIKKGDVYYNITLSRNKINKYNLHFFKYNIKTKEKIAIFNKEFNLTKI